MPTLSRYVLASALRSLNKPIPVESEIHPLCVAMKFELDDTTVLKVSSLAAGSFAVHSWAAPDHFQVNQQVDQCVFILLATGWQS